MYINPQTDIRLLRGCPIDPEYINTIYFTNESFQSNYFMGLTKYNLNNYSYQRYKKGVLRVQILADNLYDINYMMFRNTAFGTKWFYAFVDHVEYVNDITSEIYYHIDDIQTWMFDWTFNQCFIERQHTATDEIGDNIIVEPVECGEYVYNNYEVLSMYRECVVIIACTDTDGSTDGYLYDRVYSACTLYAYSASNKTGIDDKINEFTVNPDAVVSIYMCPRFLIDPDGENDTIDSGNPLTLTETSGATNYITLDDIELTSSSDIDGYTPRNKKLFTYPYNFVNIINGEGANLALRYEYFNNLTPKCVVFGTVSQPVQLELHPTSYKGLADGTGASLPQPYMDEKITLHSFPQCSWNIDSFKVWIAQNCVPIMLNIGSTAMSTALATYTPAQIVDTGVQSAITGQNITRDIPEGFDFTSLKGSMASVNAFNRVSGLLTSIYNASCKADQTKGNLSSANASFANGEHVFHYGRMSVNRQQAEIIDSFFDRYGYAINKIDTPSYHTRTSWTYLKTCGCTINGNIPSDSQNNIEQIFNNGITFWINPLHVGDYSLNNDPIPTN